MNIVTFLEESKAGVALDDVSLQEWKDKVEELGLNGQKSLINEEKGETKPVPFKVMTMELKHMYEVLCENKYEVTEFKKEPIPLKILSLISLVKTEYPQLGRIEIWASPTDDDPLAVAYEGYENYYKYKHCYLLGAWSSTDMSPEILREKAKRIWLTKNQNKLKKELVDTKYKLNNIENLAEQYMNGESVYI